MPTGHIQPHTLYNTTPWAKIVYSVRDIPWNHAVWWPWNDKFTIRDSFVVSALEGFLTQNTETFSPPGWPLTPLSLAREGYCKPRHSPAWLRQEVILFSNTGKIIEDFCEGIDKMKLRKVDWVSSLVPFEGLPYLLPFYVTYYLPCFSQCHNSLFPDAPSSMATKPSGHYLSISFLSFIHQSGKGCLPSRGTAAPWPESVERGPHIPST